GLSASLALRLLIVGSSASPADAAFALFTTVLSSADGISSFGGDDDGWRGDDDIGASGSADTVAITAACGRATVPGIKEKSSASDEEIHGTCSLPEARVTPTRMRLSVSSAINSGTRISLSSCCTNRLWSVPVSEITEESAAEYITNVPFGAITGASPA